MASVAYELLNLKFKYIGLLAILKVPTYIR